MPIEEIKIKFYVCGYCGHKWRARKYKDSKPKICPVCKREDWDNPKKKK